MERTIEKTHLSRSSRKEWYLAKIATNRNKEKTFGEMRVRCTGPGGLAVNSE
jgi:hypothetical protein